MLTTVPAMSTAGVSVSTRKFLKARRRRRMNSNCPYCRMDVDPTPDQMRLALLLETLKIDLTNLPAEDVITLRAEIFVLIAKYMQNKRQAEDVIDLEGAKGVKRMKKEGDA